MGFWLLSWRIDVVRVQVSRNWCCARCDFVTVVCRVVSCRGCYGGAETVNVSKA